MLLRRSACLGAELNVEPHGKEPHFELQGPARGGTLDQPARTGSFSWASVGLA